MVGTGECGRRREVYEETCPAEGILWRCDARRHCSALAGVKRIFTQMPNGPNRTRRHSMASHPGAPSIHPPSIQLISYFFSSFTSSRAMSTACLAYTSASLIQYRTFRTTRQRSRTGSRNSSRTTPRPRCVACVTKTPSCVPDSPPPPKKSQRSPGNAMRSCAS